MNERVAGETFLKKSFPHTPFQKLLINLLVKFVAVLFYAKQAIRPFGAPTPND